MPPKDAQFSIHFSNSRQYRLQPHFCNCKGCTSWYWNFGLQHLATQSEGHDRCVVIINESSSSNKSISPLPTSYTNVPPAALKTKEFTVPSVQGLVKPANFTTFTKAKEDEMGWLKAVMEALHKEKLDEMEWVSWSAWHANIQNVEIPPAAINCLLPLFLDSAHSVAMIKHL